MTLPALYLTDVEIARRLGVTVGEWRANAIILERQGLPAPDPLFKSRRYWPAVVAFLDRRAGLHSPSEKTRRDWKEHWDVDTGRRARIQKAHAG